MKHIYIYTNVILYVKTTKLFLFLDPFEQNSHPLRSIDHAEHYTARNFYNLFQIANCKSYRDYGTKVFETMVLKSFRDFSTEKFSRFRYTKVFFEIKVQKSLQKFSRLRHRKVFEKVKKKSTQKFSRLWYTKFRCMHKSRKC